MINKILVKIIARHNRGIVIYGKCLKTISKYAKISCHYFSFNRGWGQDCVLAKRETGKLQLEEDASLTVGENTIVRSGGVLAVFKGASLTLGDNILFNNNCEIYCHDNIIIGSNTVISNNSVIRDCDVHVLEGSINHKPIIIGNHVWVGTNCIILKGVKIGDGAVIGAGSIVTKDIPAHSLAAGNPAKVIRNTISWKR